MAGLDAERPIEAALERLEAIADKLEDPQLDLDEASASPSWQTRSRNRRSARRRNDHTASARDPAL